VSGVDKDDYTRMVDVRPGVGRPRGRGRLILKVSPGVVIDPELIFSFCSLEVDFAPVLRLDHPRAVLLALEVTRGRVGRPSLLTSAFFLGLLETLQENGENGLTSRTGTVERNERFGLIVISLRAGTAGSGEAKGLLTLSS